MIVFKKLQQIKKMISQLVVCWTKIYFKDLYKMIAINLSKQQAFDADPKAIQQTNFTGNLEDDGNENTAMFIITEEIKETVIDFQRRIVKVF